MAGKRSSFDTDDEEVPEIILRENGGRRKRGGSSREKGKRRTCCNPILIIGLVIIILVVIGLLLFFFLFKPEDKETKGNSLSGSAPASVETLEKLCSENNAEEMQTIFSTGEELYMVEFLNFADGERETFDEYSTLLSDLDGVELVQDLSDVEQWAKIIVMKYRSAAVFRQSVLENADLESMLQQRKLILDSQIFATSLNNDVPNMYPKLNNQPGNPDYVFWHALKFKSGVGREKVAIFDSDSEEIKSSNGIYSQAWLDVQATCIGQNDEFDQFRIESIPSIASYAKVLGADGWTEAHEYQEEGINGVSFSDMTDQYEMVTSLYL